MVRVLFAIALAMFFMSAQATTRQDRETCIVVYKKVGQYVAKVNARAWTMYRDSLINYEQYSHYIAVNHITTMDDFWRINRDSRVGTGQDCLQAGRNIIKTIQSNMGNLP